MKRRHGWPITIVFLLIGTIALVIGGASVVLTIMLAIALAMRHQKTLVDWFGLILVIVIVCGMAICAAGISIGMVKLVKGD